MRKHKSYLLQLVLAAAVLSGCINTECESLYNDGISWEPVEVLSNSTQEFYEIEYTGWVAKLIQPRCVMLENKRVMLDKIFVAPPSTNSSDNTDALAVGKNWEIGGDLMIIKKRPDGIRVALHMLHWGEI